MQEKIIPEEKILLVLNKKEENFLRKRTKKIENDQLKDKVFMRELRVVVKKMRDIMKHANGVGLSANQVGIPYRFFVAQVPDAQGKQKFYSIINPEISKLSEEKITIEEGCLSVPMKYGSVPRSHYLILSGNDLNGKKIKIKAWGLLARVFQHEVDHLDGKLFLDRASEVHSINIKENEK